MDSRLVVNFPVGQEGPSTSDIHNYQNSQLSQTSQKSFDQSTLNTSDKVSGVRVPDLSNFSRQELLQLLISINSKLNKNICNSHAQIESTLISKHTLIPSPSEISSQSLLYTKYSETLPINTHSQLHSDVYNNQKEAPRHVQFDTSIPPSSLPHSSF